MERVWVKSKSGAVRQVAESAVRVMKVSGWKPLTKAEVAAHEKTLAAAQEEIAAAGGRVERGGLAVAQQEHDPTTSAQPARAEQDKES